MGHEFTVAGTPVWVDFHYEVNGKIYDFSIPGGGFVSLEHVVEVLGIAGSGENGGFDGALSVENAENEGEIAPENGAKVVGEVSDVDVSDENYTKSGTAYEAAIKLNEVEVSEAAKKFVADVENVEFSSPDLVWVGEADRAVTVGDLKEANGLEVEYSAELTEEQIAEINSSIIEAGDWALISVQPFTSAESLTVTMKNGDQFVVRVTDAQVSDKDAIVSGRDYIIFYGTGGKQIVLKNDGASETFDDTTGFNDLSDEYKWTITANGNLYYIVAKSTGQYMNLKASRDYVALSPSTSAQSCKIEAYATGNNEGFRIYGQNSGNFYLRYSNGYKTGNNSANRIRLWIPETSSYTLTVTVDDSTHGTVSGTDSNGTKQNNVTSFVAATNSVTNGSTTNKNSINVGSKSGYRFVRWELRDGNTVLETYTTSSLDAKAVTLTKDGLSLVAVFEEGQQSGGGGSSEGQQVALLLEAWKNNLLNNPMKVNKTAKVSNYDNRIYQVDLSTSSNRRAVETDVSVNFIVDTSRSMYFPASITEVGTYTITNLNGWLSDKPHDNVYFIIADKDDTATMYAVYYSGNQWVYVDASYYNADDGQTRTPVLVSDTALDGKATSSGSSTRKMLSGVIYTAPDRDTGGLWTRLDYLLMAVEEAITVLYELDPNAQIGLTTFNADATYEGLFGKSQQEIESKLRKISLYGGTNQEKGLDTARTSGLFSSANTKNQYAILVTDGAPVKSYNTDGSLKSGTDWEHIGIAATNLKNITNAQGNKLTLYTLGVSISNVGSNGSSLSGIATDSEKAYQADSGQQIAEAIEGIVEGMLAQATLYGTVSDTVDPAFYPVTDDGTLISPGYYDKDGNSLGTAQSSTTEPYYKWENNNGTWTITWYNQQFAPENEGTPGWQKTFYIKAKEDFLGGNTIRTNDGGENDKVTATGFVKSDGTISSFDTPVSSTFETPYVNVDELSLDKHDTEWTVYLGTEVTPKDQIRELYNNTTVYEVVSGKDSDNRRSSESKLKTEPGFAAEAFYLKDVIGELTDTQLATLISTGTLNIDYTPYDDSRYGTDHVGTITLTLTKSGEGSDYNTHHTTTVGTPTETYTLNVKYTPSSVNSTPDYHTTSGGSPGDPTDPMEKLNTHKINVYARKLTINKVDQANGTITSPATFKLYRKAVDGDNSGNYVSSTDLPSCLPSGNSYILVEILTTSNGAVTTGDLNDAYEYYLVETQAPAGYHLLTGYFTVAVDTQSTYTKTLDTSQTSATAWSPWELSGWEEKSAVIVTPVGEGIFGYAIYGDVQGSGYTYDTNSTSITWKIRNDAGYELPSTGGPGTRLFTILGSILILGAGVLLWRRRRLI